MNERLRPVQRVAIPVYFGDPRCDGVPATLLSGISGFLLCGPDAASTNEDGVMRMPYDAFGALWAVGIMANAKLGNYHLADAGEECGLFVESIIDQLRKV